LYYQALIPALLLCLAGQLHGGDTLEAVKFEGNHAFSRRALASVVAARPKKSSGELQLSNDVATLELFYHSEGFATVEVERQVTRGKRRPVVTFYITEGPRTRVGAIAISGNATVGTDRLLRQLPVRPGRFFSQAELDQATDALRTFYLNSGYPFVQVQASATRNDTLATLSYDISEGHLCHLSAVRVRNNKTVRTGTILRALEVREGEKFSQKRLREAQSRLYATKLFYRVMFYVIADSSKLGPEGQGELNGVVVRFDVIEQPYRGVAFGAGVEYSPARALVSAEWEHDNLLNRGHTLLVSGEFSPTVWPLGRYRTGIDATYRVPYLVLTRIDFQTHPYFSYEKLDSTRQRDIGIETGMSRSLVPQFTLGLTNRLRLLSDTSHSITNSLALSGSYDTRDDIFDPGRGVSLQAVVEGAGGPLLGTNDFYRLTGDFRWFRGLGIVPARSERLTGDFVLAARAMLGTTRPYGRTDAVPYYEAFTLGGRSSVRGYDERSIGPYYSSAGGYNFGPTVANGNIELRTPYILRWVGLVGFFDAGGLSRDLQLFTYGYGAGIGIRVKTPVGPVRFDWGKRLYQPPAGDIGRFYLALLHAF